MNATRRWFRIVVLAAAIGWAFWYLRRVAARRGFKAMEGPWRRVQVSTDITASPERVWAVIVEPGKAFLTSNSVTRMELGSSQTAGVGTSYRWSFGLPFAGPRLEFVEVVTEWDEARKIVYEAVTGWTMRAVGELQPTPFGTRYLFTLEYRLRWPWSRLVPHWLELLGVHLAVASLMRRAVAVERGTRATPDRSVS